MQRLSDERLAEIRERCEKATAGPWEDFTEKYPQALRKNKKARYHGSMPNFGCIIGSAECRGEEIDPERDFPLRVDYWDIRPVVCVFSRRGIVSQHTGLVISADRSFIAHARQDIPDLLAEIERLKLALQLK